MIVNIKYIFIDSVTSNIHFIFIKIKNKMILYFEIVKVKYFEYKKLYF